MHVIKNLGTHACAQGFNHMHLPKISIICMCPRFQSYASDMEQSSNFARHNKSIILKWLRRLFYTISMWGINFLSRLCCLKNQCKTHFVHRKRSVTQYNFISKCCFNSFHLEKSSLNHLIIGSTIKAANLSNTKRGVRAGRTSQSVIKVGLAWWCDLSHSTGHDNAG